MHWYTTLYIILLLVTAGVSIALAHYAWKHRPIVGATLFSILMLAIAQWSLAHFGEAISQPLPAKMAWSKFQYIGIAIAPVAWLAFTFEYTGRGNWLIRRRLFWLSLIPTTTILLVFTNDWHHLVWREVSLVTTELGSQLVVQWGNWFWVHTIFSYGCLLIATIHLFTSWRYEIAALYRRQTAALLFSHLLPWLANISYLFKLTRADLTPISFSLSGLALARYALRFPLLDAPPISHKLVVDSISDGVLVLDKQNYIVDVNSAGQQILAPIHPHPIGEHITTYWPDLAESLKLPAELVVQHDETTRTYEVNISPLYDWRKRPRGRILVLHDITERKLQEALRDDLTRTMVHDLRAPISNSLFALEMLKGDLANSSPDSKLLLEMTFANTEKTLQLVNRILDISRLESGEMPITAVSIYLPDLVMRVLESLKPRALEKELLLINEIDASLPPAWADAELIERVLQNLLDNSIKFTPHGGTIRISAVLDDTTTPHRLLITVSDTGPGIPADIEARIFDKFVVGNHGLGGSGLGLAFCQMALAAHDQEIWAENLPERGAAFSFTLPLAPVSQLESA